jgi:ABC-type glutathione transport system ATPase component
METVAKEIKERKQYVLLDEQKVAYSLVMAAVEKARTSNKKTAVIVKGGPGSGKSVIALSLLGELSRLGYSAIHASGARAFRNSLRKVAGHRETRVKNMFQFFNSFMNTPANSIDVLLADEAHRIRETSNNRYTKREQRSTKHQVDELMEVARVPVFLLDQHQVVRPGEVGTAEYIEARAKEAGLDVEIVETFNWDKYDIKRVDVEHIHWGNKREYLFDLKLIKNGNHYSSKIKTDSNDF